MAGRDEQLGFSPDEYHTPALREAAYELGYGFEYYDEIASTMPVIDRYAIRGNKAPFVVLANHQTQGIGREGRVWHDKKGASVLASFYFPLQDPRTLAIFADLIALQACLALRSVTGVDEISVKYPNDLVAKGKKISGLLVRNVHKDDTFLGVNVGIGVNVHYTDAELETYPTDYGAASLDMIANKTNTRQQVVVGLMQGLAYRYVDAETIRLGDLAMGDLKNPIDLRRQYDLQWKTLSAVMNKEVELSNSEKILALGTVTDTQVGRGLLLDNNRWWNVFDTSMKVRIK